MGLWSLIGIIAAYKYTLEEEYSKQQYFKAFLLCTLLSVGSLCLLI